MYGQDAYLGKFRQKRQIEVNAQPLVLVKADAARGQ